MNSRIGVNMIRIFLYILASLVLVVGFQNCGMMESPDSESSSSLNEKATFTWINQEIIRPKCVECHGGVFTFSGLEFTDYDGVMDAVVPGDPNASIFYTRAFRSDSFTLTEEELTSIRVWILDGARNN